MCGTVSPGSKVSAWAQPWERGAWIPTAPGLGLARGQVWRYRGVRSDCFFTMQMTLSVNSMDSDRELCS